LDIGAEMGIYDPPEGSSTARSLESTLLSALSGKKAKED
jgi:hypothetical protein